MNPAVKHRFNYVRAPYMKQRYLTPQSYQIPILPFTLKEQVITLNIASKMLPDLHDDLLKP